MPKRKKTPKAMDMNIFVESPTLIKKWTRNDRFIAVLMFFTLLVVMFTFWVTIGYQIGETKTSLKKEIVAVETKVKRLSANDAAIISRMTRISIRLSEIEKRVFEMTEPDANNIK